MTHSSSRIEWNATITVADASSTSVPSTVIDSVADLGDLLMDIDKTLEKIRATVRKAAPTAEETIKYGMPTFTLNGRNLVSFGVFKEHIGFYPLPKEFVKEAGAWVGAKSSLHFPFDEPIPFDLIEKIVRFRAKRLKVR